MSTPPFSREPSLRLSSPEPERPAFTRSGSSARPGSSAIAPKSEYLRNALQARRAQNTSTPPPCNARPPPPAAADPPALLTPRTSPDVFDRFALTEEQTTPVSPIRRQRPGEAGLPPSKTNRELTTEIERLKDNLMTSKLRVELLKKNNHELQVDLTKAKEAIEQLEPLEEENAALSNENNLMRLKLERYEDELLHLRDSNTYLREANEALVATNNESVHQFETQDVAFKEAIEIIANLEDEKDALKQELRKIKDRVVAIETGNNSPLHVDGSLSYPARVCSIDDSCPSTTHFDSDYYSQPASPRGDPDKASIRSNHSLTTSMRSKRFLELSLQHRQSAQDLTKRMSQASLRAASLRSSAIAPDVSQIPGRYEQAKSDRAGDITNVTKHRYREPSYLEQSHQPYYMDASQQQPSRPATVTPQLKVPRPSGLRAMYDPNEVTGRRQSHHRCSSSSHDVSTSNNTRTWSRQSSVFNSSPPAPPRTSSRHAYTGSFDDKTNEYSQRSVGTDESPTSDIPATPEYLSSEWAAPARHSIVSDLTSVVPDPRDKDRWWKSVDRLTQAEAKEEHQRGESEGAAHLKNFRARDQLIRANSSPHAGTHAGFQEDDQFLKRVQAKIFRRKEPTNVTN